MCDNKINPEKMTENEKLYLMADTAKRFAYAPYSDFKVGAALLTDDCVVYMGCNVENISYGATICAERNAVFKAVSEGKRRFSKIAIASDSEDYTYPCGMCLQVIREFMPDGEIIIGGKDKELKVYKMSDLMPKAFTDWK